ncbi:MAG: hypothetical protein JOZ54_24425 [Acidobacteria bacterium]|nr:hypothetical protein [Acidobacteriota bacterium]
MQPAIWKEKRILLIVLGILLVANTIFFFTYRVRYENRLESLDDRLEASKARLAQARASRVAAERRYASYQKIQADVQEIYDERWSTPERRLAPLIVEIKRLALASQLVPKTYSFSQTEAAAEQRPGQSRSTPTGASTVGISYTVSGTYEQARRLINLLELSEQFVIVDAVSITTGEKDLTLNLHLKTLFRDDKTPAGRAAGQPL